MEVDRENGGMPDLGCGMSDSPIWIATQDSSLVLVQGGALIACHEGCETINPDHHQRSSERGAGRIILMLKTLICRFVVLPPLGEGLMAAL